MPRKPGIPAYRRRIIRGRKIAIVTLYDVNTRRRRDVWLGEYGSPESHAKYVRTLAKWEENGHLLPDCRPPIRPAAGPTVTQVVAEYWSAIGSCNYSPGHVAMIRTTLRRWREHYGQLPAAEITPAMLRDWRAAVAREASPLIAQRSTAVVLAMCRWAVSYDLMPINVYQRLKTIEPLRRSRKKTIGPAPMEAVNAVRDHVSAQVRAMIDLQLLTGMRPGEVCQIRPCDITMSANDNVWYYRPETHKTAHHGHERIVYLGPQAQMVLRPFLTGRATTAYCFSAAEAMATLRAARHAARKTPLSCGNRPGMSRKTEPQRRPSERYIRTSYTRAITRACAQAGVPHWHPHQLRHNYATEVRKRYGLEAARILLGHCSALVTEAVYAERDQQAAMRIAAEIG